MKTKVEEKGPTKRLVEVELPPEIVARKLEEAYRRAAREVSVPGFRRGHAPRALLEAQFGRDFLYGDSQEELVREYLPQALKELDLRPVVEPQAKVLQFEEGKPLIFQAEVEVLPEVEVDDYWGIEVEEIPKPEAGEKAIAAELDRLRRAHATLIPKEGGVAEPGDVAIVTERVVDGRGRTLRESQEVEWEVEEKDKLLGRRVGETVEVALGKGERGLVKIEELKRVELPPLDDAFAKECGYASLEELRRKVTEEINARLEEEHECAMKLSVLDELIDRTALTIPERLVEESLEEDLKPLREAGLPPLTEEELAEERRRRVRAIKRELVLAAIKRREGLELSDEEFEEELEKEAARRGVDLPKLKGLLEREGGLKEFRRSLEDQRVLDLLYKRAKIVKRGKKHD
ncbi:MAG: trigger factor [Candidatus Acetothermia bacterium]|jgi:trigger factor|nr:trigger factor [Candidatus Acetothermia bacterium]MDH7504850.1 trigger factor [Candidatus Acetothermia bacterium]